MEGASGFAAREAGDSPERAGSVEAPGAGKRAQSIAEDHELAAGTNSSSYLNAHSFIS